MKINSSLTTIAISFSASVCSKTTVATNLLVVLWSFHTNHSFYGICSKIVIQMVMSEKLLLYYVDYHNDQHLELRKPTLS